MCESADGFITIATRQCAGSISGGAVRAAPAAGAGAPSPCADGGVNGPAAVHWAEVIVVFGRASFASASHCVGSASIPASNSTTALPMGHPPSHQFDIFPARTHVVEPTVTVRSVKKFQRT